MTRIDELKRAVAKAAVFAACALLPAISSASQDTDAMKAANAAATSVQGGGHVYVVNGDVFVARGDNPAHRVIGNEAIVSNTLVNTGANSSALLKFDDDQTVTMQPDSSFQVREYRYDANKIENSNIVFTMFKGGMRFVTGLIGKARKQAFRLSTPNATIGIRGTEFMVAMADKSMYSQVLAGKITMTNAAGMQIVGAGQSAVVASTAALASVIPASSVPSGTFSELLSIPADPAAIPAPAPAPEPAPSPAPVPPVPAAEVGAAVSVAGVAGGLMAGVAGSESESTQEAAPEAAPPEEEAKPEPAPAPAENQMAKEESRSGVGITGKIGTLGLGAELNLAFSDSFGARLGYNGYTYKYNKSVNSVDYDAKLQLKSVSLLGDWYPFKGSFRTSAGVVFNDNQATLTGIPSGGGSYTINGTPYTFSGSLQGKLSFNKVAPYFGIGWGNPVAKNKGWGMTTDFGVLFQGSPNIKLEVTCTSGSCPTASDVATEENKMQNDLKQFKFWPVMSIGISYQW